MKSIGGTLSLAALTVLAADPAQQHRPADPVALAAAARDMAARGLTPRDIASALRLSSDAVADLLKLDPVDDDA